MAKRIISTSKPKIRVKTWQGSTLDLDLEHPVYAAVAHEDSKDVRPGSSPYTIGEWVSSFRDNRPFLVETSDPGLKDGTVRAHLAEVVSA